MHCGSYAAAALVGIAGQAARALIVQRHWQQQGLIKRQPDNNQHTSHQTHAFVPCITAFAACSVIISKPTQVPPNATFSLVAGSHTHYFAAEGGQRAAELWVTLIRETWLHCFSHTARCTGGGAGVVSLTASASGVMVSQKLLAENALLRESIQELNQQVTQTNGEYWR